MPIQPPNLDDRRFADLVAEAKTLIPRYVPEWTDLNESDPGMTLVELFAWMTDILLYRLNLVPERNYLKFLQLLGTEQQPAQPARADLTFTLLPSVLDSVIIPKGTKVGAAGSVVFETEENLTALAATLQAVQSFDGMSYSVHTRKNAQPGQDFFPFGTLPRAGNTLLLGFDAPNSFTDQPIDLAVYTSAANLKVNGLQCSANATLDAQPAMVVWEYWNGKQWLPLSLDKDETGALTQDGHIVFMGPGSRCQRAQLGLAAGEFYWLRARLLKSAYQMAPCLQTLLTNTVRAVQAVTVSTEILGSSNGLPLQQFILANTPIVVRTPSISVTEPLDPSDRPQASAARPYLTAGRNVTIPIKSLWLQVDEGNGLQTWQEVSDFYASGSQDRHYTLNRTTGQVTFGDGLHGRIPRMMQQSNSIVAREYMYGGGSQGNVGPNTITAIQDTLPGVDSVTNLRAAFGGTDEETLEEAKQRVPRELKSKGRAVTAEDFEFIAVQTPGAMIRRSKALPLAHPRFPGQTLPGLVTLIVVPERDPASNAENSPPPMPTPATLELVCAHLDKHRLLTAEVYIVPPTYHDVRIDTTLVATSTANLAVVRQNVITSLRSYFDPLTGGDDGQGWPFGGSIYFSKLYRLLMEIEGVDYIQNNQLIVYVDGEPSSYKDIPLEPGSLPYFNDYDIRLLSL
jgi:hypothetical protein